MRYDVEAEVYVENRVPDGKGGRTVNRVKVGRIFCIFTPISESTQTENYGVNKKGYYRVVTYDPIVPERFILKIFGDFYKPYSDKEWTNRRIIMVERIDD